MIRFWKKARRFLNRIASIPERLTLIQNALGRIEQRQIAHSGAAITDAEFKVYSQWGEDGIIQYLVRRVPIERKLFVEFGVENYAESNTRFLALNDVWSGLVIDGSEVNVAEIKRDPIYWSNNIKAEHAFITRDNINDLIRSNGIEGDIGLLSVDIDGNDYWVWQAIDCIHPRIVICEYNSLFGPKARVTVPYNPAFVREQAHFSRVFYGASIAALCQLAVSKGYTAVAGNSAGNNVFFVRNDVLGSLEPMTAEKLFRPSRFREFHDERGNLTYSDFGERLAAIGHLTVHDLDSGQTLPLEMVPGIAAYTDFTGGARHPGATGRHPRIAR